LARLFGKKYTVDYADYLGSS